MNRVFRLFASLLLLFLSANAQVLDLKRLIGKKAVAQRQPLYKPGTYQQIPNTYAGQTATIIGVKPSTLLAAMPKLTARQMASLPPQSRENIENVLGAATITIEFEDGTKADTGANPVLPSMLSTYLELLADLVGDHASGETPKEVAAGQSKSIDLEKPNRSAVGMEDVLTDAQIKIALAGEGKTHATFIMDGGSGAPSLTPLIPSLTLFMPEAVLALKSASAKSQFIAYDPTAEDKRKALMIQAHGGAGATIQEGCTSVTRVVLLSDPTGRLVKEAYLSEPSTQVWKNGFGATNQCDDLIAKFSLSDVEQVKAAAPDGEFYVAVFSGTIKTKTYKVKSKFQSKLGLH